MPDVAIRRFASPCLPAGFVGPRGSGGLGEAIGNAGLFGSNIWDGTRAARRAGDIRSTGTRRVAQLAGSPGRTPPWPAATTVVDATYGAIRPGAEEPNEQRDERSRKAQVGQ